MYLRSYKAEDLPGMFALDEVCFDAPFRFSSGMMRRMASMKNAIVQLVCEAGSPEACDDSREHLLGFCIVHLDRRKTGVFGYVVTLDVDPAARRQGIAAMLMQITEEAAAAGGATAMRLHVYAGNPRAIRLYERSGYMLARAAKDFYGPGLDALVYVKLLGTKVAELEQPSSPSGA